MRLEETYEQFKQLENERKKVVNVVCPWLCVVVVPTFCRAGNEGFRQ